MGPAASALLFTLNASSKQLVVSSAGSVRGLCVVDSNAGTVSHSNGFLANVFLTACTTAAAKATSWELSGCTIRSSDQCLDVGSAGSSGDLGFELKLLPAAAARRRSTQSLSSLGEALSSKIPRAVSTTCSQLCLAVAKA